MIKVKCISTDISSTLEVDKVYKIDITTIYGDCDGDWYGIIFTENNSTIGNYKLSHFKSI